MGSEIENPYAPPRTDRLEADRRLDQPDQAWRDGKLLVVRKNGAVLPDRCLKCNAPAEGYRFTRNVSWINSLWVALVLLSPLIFIIVYFIVRWTANVSVGLCPRHRQVRKLVIVAAWLIALAGFGGFGLAAVLPDSAGVMSVLTGIGLLFIAMMVGAFGTRVLLPTKIDKHVVWLAKVSPDYLAELPCLEGVRDRAHVKEKPMVNTLADLCPRASADECPPESTRWSMIAVEPVGFVGKKSEFVGVVILDRRCRSDAHIGRSTVFRVEAGDHTVLVHIKRRFRVAGYRGRAEASLRVVVEPGENLDLVFGVAKNWCPPKTASKFLPIFLLMASYPAFFGIGWHAYPFLREAVAWATQSLGIRQPWSSFVNLFVSTRAVTGLVMMSAWVIIAQVCSWKLLDKRSGVPGNLYFLSRRPEPGKPAPVFKAHYVDPFE